MDSPKYDAIFVGTGFATSFFLLAYLRHSGPSARVLVLERGQLRDHAWQLENPRQRQGTHDNLVVNRTSQKPWIFQPDFGGGSNSWWACTPRMLPEDFQIRSLYNVGVDWPVSYDDLEEHYSLAEEIMAVSGPSDDTPFPRSRAYPQPPHLFTAPEKLLKKAFPDQFFHQPTARPTQDTAHRPACCAAGVCDLCPIDSPFSILNELFHLYQDERVTLKLGATVQQIEITNSQATGVVYTERGATRTIGGDLVVLGANAIFNPHILLRSGLEHPLLGKRLNEQVSVDVDVLLDGVDNFQGSTSITGHGYMLYGGAHRARHAAALIETWNIPKLRDERGKWLQRLQMKCIFEDLPDEQNSVSISSLDPTKPEVAHFGHSEYARGAIAALDEKLPQILKALPVESYRISPQPNVTEGHIQGTTLMGRDPAESVVDWKLVHHDVRNLVVLGSSVFPTCPPANPTLTIAALSLWSASKVLA